MNTLEWVPFQRQAPVACGTPMVLAGKNGYFYIREYHQIVCGINSHKWYTLDDIDGLIPITHWRFLSPPQEETNYV